MSDKLCIDCTHFDTDNPMSVCQPCISKSNWQSKCCASCKHAPENPEEEPCLTCGNYSNWKPDEDDVNHPAHYTQGGIECIDAIRAALTPEEWRGYLKGNCLKYIWRERGKGGNKDIEKAEWYIRRLLEEV